MRNRNQRSPIMGVERGSEWRSPTIDHSLSVRDKLVPVRRCDLRVKTRIGDDFSIPALNADIQQEWPYIQLIVVGAFDASGWEQVVQQPLGKIGIPRLDCARLGKSNQLQERRDTAVHVPCARFVLCLGHESIEAKAFS